jgi:hypothetical protein
VVAEVFENYKKERNSIMKRKITIIAFLGFIIFFLSMEAQAVDWKLCGTTVKGDSLYYEPQSIKWVAKDIVQVWEKTSYSEKRVPDAIRKLGPAYNELSYAIALGEFNCIEKKCRTLSLSYYNQYGVVIGSFTYDSPSWSFTVPGSMNEALFNIVCGGR